jgi:Mg2+ and Co2+ transporter CorA
MNILDSILEKWNQDKDIENLISSELLADKNAIQKCLDNLNEVEKDKCLSILSEIQSNLQEYIAGIEKNISETKQQIDSTHKSEKACLSYGSSVDIQNNKKEDK